MNKPSYAMMLRLLSSDYYQNRMDMKEYRQKRKILLDRIDSEFNREEASPPANEEREDAPTFMQTVAFYQNSDADK